MVRGRGPHLDCPSLDTGSVSLLAPPALQFSLPAASVAHALLAIRSCDLAQLFPLSGPQFPCLSNTVKAFAALTCWDFVWKPLLSSNLHPLRAGLWSLLVPSLCPAKGWRVVRAH